MKHHIKTILVLFICLILCFTGHAASPPIPVTISETPTVHYIYETINIPGVDFLEVTASNDQGDYAGNTKSPVNNKIIGFTLIDGVFTTYDVPDSRQTTFYGLNNAGQAVGFYENQNEKTHGLILQDGELTEYKFPLADQTQIFGIGEEGQLIGDTIDESGNIQGFIGDMQFDVPDAISTYVDDINAAGLIVGSYLDKHNVYHGFIHFPDGSFYDIDVPGIPKPEYLFVNAINDAFVIVFRAKVEDDIERSYVLHPNGKPVELRYPGSVETVLRDIDTQGNIYGYYDMPDGRRHGCVIRPVSQAEAERYNNVFHSNLNKGLNMLSLPLESSQPMTAKSLAGLAGATVVIALDAEKQSFVGWTPNAPNDGFTIEGGQGYIVNVTRARSVLHVGAGWTNQTKDAAAAPIAAIPSPHETWAFVVSGHLENTQNYDGYLITVRNLRTNSVMTAQVNDQYFAAATVDLARRSVVQVGDTLEVTVSDKNGNIASEIFSFEVTPNSLANALLTINLDGIGKPKGNLLLQNYPNPFNPETWIPYQLSNAGYVSISIYDATGGLVRTLAIGYQSEGFYHNRGRAAYWDGKNTLGESVASGIYFYKIETPSFQQTRQLVILK